MQTNEQKLEMYTNVITAYLEENENVLGAITAGAIRTALEEASQEPRAILRVTRTLKDQLTNIEKAGGPANPLPKRVGGGKSAFTYSAEQKEERNAIMSVSTYDEATTIEVPAGSTVVVARNDMHTFHGKTYGIKVNGERLESWSDNDQLISHLLSDKVDDGYKSSLRGTA